MRHSTSKRRKLIAAGGIAATLALGTGGTLAGVAVAQDAEANGNGIAGLPSIFRSSVPTRIVDTRTGTGLDGQSGPIGPQEALTIDISTLLTEFDGPNVNSIVVNVGVENPSMQSYIALLPPDTDPGTTSNLNFSPRQTISNQAIVRVTNGTFVVYNAVGSTEVFIDLLGVFENQPA